jgi:hypothetical protein
MTPQEQDMIGDLIDRVQKTQLAEKDPDAEQMLQQGLSRTPDALYILAQTVLVQKYALDQAQTQLAQAKEQIQQMQQHPEPKHATSFLGNLLGLNREQQEPAPPPQARPQSYAPPPPPPPPYAPVGYGSGPAGPYAGGPGYGAPPMGMPGGGGFLQNAMQTAAGVAAGALAFEGVESLMHGFGHAAGYGGGSGLGSFGGADQRPTETVTNNYYDDNRGDHGDQGSHDVTPAERTLGDSENYSANDDKGTGNRDSLYGANDTTTADTSGNLDNTSLDDSSADDSSDNFDSSNDGGGFDDSSSGFDDGGGGGGGDDSGF